MTEASYTTARRDGSWVVLRDDRIIVGRHPAGPTGAEAAAAQARQLNRRVTARDTREERAANPVRSWRVTHNLSQGQLAKHLGVRVFTLQRWEYGESDPPQYLQLALERLEQLLPS